MSQPAVTLPFPTRLPARAWLQIRQAKYLAWSPYTLRIPNLPNYLNDLRILHLTDLHMTPQWMPVFDEVMAHTEVNPPDLICISGDFVDSKHDPRPALSNVRKFIGGLRSRLGIYGTLGNHDGDWLPTMLNDWPVRLLFNESVRLADGETAVEIVGLHGVEPWDVSPRVLSQLTPKAPGTLRIVMAHYPHQAWLLGPGVADVVLTGHTHGGQVCLPGGWPPITHERSPRRFARGVHWLGDRWLAVGRGLGFSTYRVRAFCPPEAIELTLRAGNPTAS